MWPKQTIQLLVLLIVFGLSLTGCVQYRSLTVQNPVNPDKEVGRKSGQMERVAIIKAEVLPEIDSTIAKAKADGAKRIAPLSHARAVEKLKSLDAFISVNPEAKDEIDVMAADALFEANRLMVITQQARQVKEMKPEDVALSMEKQLQTISEAVGEPDMRNRSPLVQVDSIVSAIYALKKEHSILSATVKSREAELSTLKSNYQEQIDTLHVQKAALEDQSLENRLAKERMAKERLAMERHLELENLFNQRFLTVRNYFQVDEADVLKQERQVIIRIKAMYFPVGKSTILIENYELLGKVQKAILTFDDPRVIVEGHTDATGPETVNMELSQERAEAVRQYLIANGTLPSENISAVGYGAEMPLASNRTSAGRAINRRIDVLIIPETKPM